MPNPRSKKFILIIVVLVGIAAALFYWFQNRGIEKTDDASIEANIIPIAPKVAGYVQELHIDDNQHVKKGDVLLKIDPRDYQVALQQAQADLAAAQARLVAGQHNYASTSVSAPSNLTSAQTQVDAAQANWKNASLALKRLQKLSDAARSRQSLEDAIAAEKSARSSLEDAQAKLKSAETAPDTVAASEAAVKELQADVDRAQASVDKAQDDLDDTTVIAQQDGIITRKNVEVGTYVQPGQQLSVLVGDDIWVVANFKETQLVDMKPGQPVDVDVDAYPDITFHGKVNSIQAGTGSRFSLFPPENATGNFVKIVQRVPVKITFDQRPDPKYAIGPGMSVVPKVNTR